VAFFYNPHVERYAYDVNKAKELLQQEGFRDRNKDGVLEDKDGVKVRFTLVTNAESPERIQMANLIRKDLSLIGIEVNIIQLQFNTLVTKVTVTYDWDALVFGFTGESEPHFGANVWLSNAPLHIWYPLQKSPLTTWEKRLDEIFTCGVSLTDKNERKKLYDEWQSIVADEAPLIHLVIPDRIVAVNNRLGNIKPTPLGGVLHNIEEIYVKKIANK
jgi:peptide/nickel transport system substrate-binding protein